MSSRRGKQCEQEESSLMALGNPETFALPDGRCGGTAELRLMVLSPMQPLSLDR